MNKKLGVLVIALVLVAALIVPSAFAAATGQEKTVIAPPAQAKSPLTDEQQQELNDLLQKKAEIQKQMVQKMVDFGRLTQEQADNIKQKIDQRTKYRLENGFGPGNCPGYGLGYGMGRQGGRGGCPGWSGNPAIQQ